MAAPKVLDTRPAIDECTSGHVSDLLGCHTWELHRLDAILKPRIVVRESGRKTRYYKLSVVAKLHATLATATQQVSLRAAAEAVSEGK